MSAATLAQETAARIKVIARVHGKTMALAMLGDARERDVIPHCDCSRCCLVKLFRDQFDAKGNRRGV